MPRILTSDMLQAMMAEATGEAILILITIDHDTLLDALRLTSDGVPTVSNGDTYVPYPFRFRLPDHTPDRPPACRVEIDNVDTQIMDALEAIETPATFKIAVVRSGDLDTEEVTLSNFRLSNISETDRVIQGDLTISDPRTKSWPMDIYSPADFRGLF